MILPMSMLFADRYNKAHFDSSAAHKCEKVNHFDGYGWISAQYDQKKRTPCSSKLYAAYLPTNFE